MKEIESGILSYSNSHISIDCNYPFDTKRLNFGRLRGLGCNDNKKTPIICIGVKTN